MLLCKDCKWVEKVRMFHFFSVVAPFPKCLHPSAVREPEQDFVTGTTIPQDRFYCNTNRMSFTPGSCGPEAQYWESKE